MTNDIIKDLTSKKARQVFSLLSEFNRNANYGGYFYNGPEAAELSKIAKYDNTPRHGFHITTWHRQNGSLNPVDFLTIVTQTQPFDARILGYADNGKNQAIAVTRPPVFMTPALPHITISWVNNGNPAASGYIPSWNSVIPLNIPEVLKNGTMKFIMHNNREMDLSMFQSGIKALEIERMNEIASKLDPKIKAEIDGHYDTMNWEELKSRFISTGLEFNETMAKLYAAYRVDTTDDKVSLSAKMNECWKEDEKADRESDEEHEERNDD